MGGIGHTGTTSSVVTLALLVTLAGCDALLTDPAPSPGTVEVSFQLVEGPLGGSGEAFAKVRRAFVRFVRPDQVVRDTVLAVTPVEGRIRVPVALEVEERVEGLGIVASLGYQTTPLFEGSTTVRIEPGGPTTAVIDVRPIPAAVVGEATAVFIPNPGESIQLSSAVLFASGDTVTGLEGTWLSEDPTIISVTPDGVATALALGQTRLQVSYDAFTDTIVAATSTVDTIEVLPESLTLLVDESSQLAPTLRDELGNVLVGRTVTWATLDPSVAVVDATGLVRAVAVGATGIVATSQDAVTTVPVRVGTPGVVHWVATAGGNWSDPSNWSTGAVPGPGDAVEITIDGTYTVTMDADVSVSSLTVGGTAGAQTLSADGRTLGVSGLVDVAGTGGLDLTGTTVTAADLSVGSTSTVRLVNTAVQSAVDNAGVIVVDNTTSISGVLTTRTGSTIRVESSTGATLTVADGFTNNGRIELTSQLGNPSALAVTTGTLTNAAGGTIQALVGNGGQRTIDADVANLSTIDLETDLTITGRLSDPVGAPSAYSSNGSTLRVSDVAVDGAVFVGMPLVVDGTTLTQFDNVTFDQMDPTAVQLTVRHPGAAGSFLFISPTFLTVPTTGLYIQAVDRDGAAPALVIDLENAAAAQGPTFTAALNGAVVNWL